MKYKRLSDYLTLIKLALDESSDKKDWAKAKHYGEIALTKLSHLSYSPSEEYLLYKMLGDAYSCLAEYSRSLDIFYKAYLIATKHRLRPVDIAYTSLMMVENLLCLRYLKQAFVQFQKVEQYYQKYGNQTFPMDEEMYVRTYLYIGYYYLYQKELKKVQEIIEEKFLPYQAIVTKGSFLIDYQHLKGEYLIELKDYPQAAQSFRQCIGESQQIGYPRGALEAKIHLSIIELLNNQLSATIGILEEVLKDARAHKLTDLTCEAGIFLSKCYLIQGMPEKATRVETRIKPLLNRLDTVWLYEKNREVEELFRRPTGPVATSFLSLGINADDILTNAVNLRRETSPYKNIIGRSAAMQEVYQLLDKIAPTDLPVLIQGETGTGKELVAGAIHQNSPRKARTYLAFNCSTIPDTLIESHLFGHTRGAFTGAIENKKGYIELASGGTLFMDEIGNMPPAMQQKLLRILEERMVRPIGAEKLIPFNTRFIFASNQNIEELVRNKLFREDLYYRINTIVITLPPLRERKEDIPLLVQHFLHKYCLDNQPKIISSDVLNILTQYNWYGNVRELENEIKRIYVLYPNISAINKGMLSESVRNCSGYLAPPVQGEPVYTERNECVGGGDTNKSRPVGTGMPPTELARPDESGRSGGRPNGRADASGITTGKGAMTLKELTAIYHRNIIIETLAKCNGNISQAARLLGFARMHLYRKMKQLRIPSPS